MPNYISPAYVPMETYVSNPDDSYTSLLEIHAHFHPLESREDFVHRFITEINGLQIPDTRCYNESPMPREMLHGLQTDFMTWWRRVPERFLIDYGY